MKQLHGDGVHDDSGALQALIDGESVVMPDGSVQQTRGPLELPPGTYLCRRQLVFGEKSRL